MAATAEDLARTVAETLGDAATRTIVALGEVTVVVPHDRLVDALRELRDRPACRFEVLVDVCGVDWSAHAGSEREGPRYAIEEMTEPRVLVLRHPGRVG